MSKYLPLPCIWPLLHLQETQSPLKLACPSLPALLYLPESGFTDTTNRHSADHGSWRYPARREGKALCHDDFAAVATDLVRRQVTRPGRIAASGGSNGGLIGNMLTRYPKHFGALLCTHPLVDMRRYTKLMAGPLWISEYGDPDKPKDWEFLQQISAYHAAAADDAAPPILLMTSRLDDRVHPGHARKMAAKLQGLRHKAWFFENNTGGHSNGNNNHDQAYFEALGLAFLHKSIGWRNALENTQA